MSASANNRRLAASGALAPPGRGRAILLVLVLLAVGLLAGCGRDDEAGTPGDTDTLVSDAGPQHVHGIGVDPTGGDLYIATHSGLWRAPKGEAKAHRVGDVRHDLMGFTVAGANEFLASGHPDASHDLPARLGLQRSTDGGRSWETVSLLGKADLHVLRAAGQRLYGVDSGTGALLTSGDGGRAWDQRTAPAPVFDLAIAPTRPGRILAATERGLFASTDTGRSWRPLRDDIAGLLAWPAEDALYLVEGDGTVSRSTNGGQDFKRAGSVKARPEAFAAAGEQQLYAAVHGGEVVVSADGGATWRTRSKP